MAQTKYQPLAPAVRKLDALLQQHLRLNGTAMDKAGVTIVTALCQAATEEPGVQVALIRYGLSSREFCEAYAFMVETLRPNPLIMHGQPMLAASLMVTDMGLIIHSLDSRYHDNPGLHGMTRQEAINMSFYRVAIALRDSHAASFGWPQFTVDQNGRGWTPSSQRSEGCMGAIVTIGSLGFLILSFLLIARF